MKIESKLIKDLKPATYNPRQISKKQYNDLKESVKKFGLVDPLIVNKDMTVIGGHQRLKVCKDLKYIEIDCVVLDLTKEQERELNIRLNKSGGEFDMDILANEFDVEELKEWGFKDIDFGFNIDKITEGNTEDDHIPEVKESRVKLGDVWQLGKHRLMCGDSTKETDVKKLMNGHKADMVFTDPPYGINYENKKGGILGDEDIKVFKDCLPILKKFSKDDSHFYIWCASGDMFPLSVQYFSNFIDFKNLLPIRVTHENRRNEKGAFKRNFETCLFGNNNKKGFNSSKKIVVSQTTLIDKRYKGDGKLKVYPALWDEERSTEHNLNIIHPTQKNVKMIEFYIEISSNINDVIIDLFLGSGSTLIACEKTNRTCYGMELDTKYCDVIIERWEQFTGQKAKKCG